MYCENCGAMIPEGSRFCPECGSKIGEVSAEGKETGLEKAEASVRKNTGGLPEGRKVTENIYLCPDGKYRWYYEFPMMKNPTILFTVFKVLGLAVLITAVIIGLINLLDGSGIQPAGPGEIRILGGVILVFVAIVLISYTILAASYGWKYLVLFEMDEERIVHMQMPRQFEKAKVIGWLTALAGGNAGSPAAAGIGLNILNKNKSTCAYSRVKKVKAVRSRHVIYVSEGLEHNQIYADDPDFDFVMDYISARCGNAKIYR